MALLNKTPMNYESILNLQGHYWLPYGLIQQERIIKKCKSAGIPSILVKRGKKYGQIEYDFLHTDYILKEEPLKIIKSLFKCMEELSKLNHPLKRSYIPGKTYGESKKFEIDICRLIAPLISTIIYDPENWEVSIKDQSIETRL